MDQELRRLLNRSACARAIFGVYRTLARARCGGLTTPALIALFKGRFSASTVAHDRVSLARLRALAWDGTWRRTRNGRQARVWRAI